MTRNRISLLAFLFLLFATQSLCAHAEKLLIYGDDAYAPVISLYQGKAVGILPRIFARISKDTGDSYDLVLVPWKRALMESALGKGGITNISLNKEREKLYDFSEPIYNDDLHLVVLKGHEFNFNELNDLKGKSIGGAAGASYGEEFDKVIADGLATIERDPNQFSRLRKLLKGRMNIAIVGNGMAGFELLIASDPELSAERDKFVVLPKPLAIDPLYLAFAKSMNMKPVLARFNKALIELKKTKEYQQLLTAQDSEK